MLMTSLRAGRKLQAGYRRCGNDRAGNGSRMRRIFSRPCWQFAESNGRSRCWSWRIQSDRRRHTERGRGSDAHRFSQQFKSVDLEVEPQVVEFQEEQAELMGSSSEQFLTVTF